ncbi:hypothetical protein A2U01_0019916, partial [Trifolium medium]|nr:hypothetical protein [Trifolium medium]
MCGTEGSWYLQPTLPRYGYGTGTRYG